MSKLIFSTLSILVLLLSGVNCSTGRGGEGSQIDGLKEATEIPRVITCKVGLELNPGDGCSGPDYSLHNNAGWLIPKGSYIEKSDSVHIGADPTKAKKQLSYSDTFSDGNFDHGNPNHIFGGSGEDFKVLG